MSKCLSLCLLALTSFAAVSHGRAQGPKAAAPAAASSSEKEKAPSVIPAPRAEPVVPPSPAKSIASQLNDAYVSVFERVAPTVVVIDIYKRGGGDGEGSDFSQDFFFQTPTPNGERDSTDNNKGNGSGKPNKGGGSKGVTEPSPDAVLPSRPSSEGSGFIIQSSGYILTNDHVVSGASTISVRLKDGRQFPAKLVGADDKTDIAVIKIEASDLPVAELADSDATRVGEIACAIGVPYSQDYSFTTGIVSAKGRRLNMMPDGYEDYIQTDASINPGNSGGPLVNLDGKVIGMNALIRGYNRGLGFAIPANMLRQVGDQLIHMGRVVRAYIGVRIISADDAVKTYGSVFSGLKKGVFVDRIMADSPAFKSDLRQTDVILDVDGVAVSTDREFQKQILSKKVGATVQLTVQRRSKTVKMAVTTAELPAPPPKIDLDSPGGPEDSGSQKETVRQFYGLQLQELTKELAERLNLNATSGVLVTSVAEDSPAAKANISVRDVITAIDDKPVKDVNAFKEAVKAADPKKGILCYIERQTDKAFAVIKTE